MNFWKKEKFYIVSYKDVVLILYWVYDFYRKKNVLSLLLNWSFGYKLMICFCCNMICNIVVLIINDFNCFFVFFN